VCFFIGSCHQNKSVNNNIKPNRVITSEIEHMEKVISRSSTMTYRGRDVVCDAKGNNVVTREARAKASSACEKTFQQCNFKQCKDSGRTRGYCSATCEYIGTKLKSEINFGVDEQNENAMSVVAQDIVYYKGRDIKCDLSGVNKAKDKVKDKALQKCQKYFKNCQFEKCSGNTNTRGYCKAKCSYLGW
jgi:hypothetical protein